MKNAFENGVCKMTSISSWPQWVKNYEGDYHTSLCTCSSKKLSWYSLWFISGKDNQVLLHHVRLRWPFWILDTAGIILGMGSANERWRYNVTSPVISWAHTQNDPCTWEFYNKKRKMRHLWEMRHCFWWRSNRHICVRTSTDMTLFCYWVCMWSTRLW